MQCQLLVRIRHTTSGVSLLTLIACYCSTRECQGDTDLRCQGDTDLRCQDDTDLRCQGYNYSRFIVATAWLGDLLAKHFLT